jgi:hypothetical protein
MASTIPNARNSKNGAAAFAEARTILKAGDGFGVASGVYWPERQPPAINPAGLTGVPANL